MDSSGLSAWFAAALSVIWCALCLGLALYGFNALWLVARSWRARRRRAQAPVATPPPIQDWPTVTVQLPLFNERHVAERVIDAAAGLRYPPRKLEIQVLDDSTDRTRQLARRRVRFWRHRGVDITYLPRTHRTEFKAGALQHGLERAKGEFLALFDADFQPPPDFLLHLIPEFRAPQHRKLGFLQARWVSVNPEESCIARAVTVAVDGHFAVESHARESAGLWFGFNGSAGIWRRRCLEDPRVGAWSGQTLCEDLDLSYRAQLAGWRGGYADRVTVPSDVPAQVASFRVQQFRWAKGSVQTLRLMGRKLLGATQRPLGVRLQGLFHLGAYFLHPCLLALMVLSLPMILLEPEIPFWLPGLAVSALGPLLMMGYGQWIARDRHRPRHWLAIVPLTLMGVALCYSNTLAVAEGLRGQTGEFERTPKGLAGRGGASPYIRDAWPLENRMFPGETLLTLYCLIAVMGAIYTQSGGIWPVPLLGLCSFGFLTVWSRWDRRTARPDGGSVPAGASQTGPGHV